ncbi:MAG: T9SS C-terminal target domain-containing protein [Bacteroidetes bacterium]|nr:MAG: T9SS C-terminal target domain-containing protein [Bacteroidota bacterium]
MKRCIAMFPHHFRRLLVISLLLLILYPQTHAQRRYREAVFDSVLVDTNVVYGNNISIQTGLFEPFDLLMDVYMPAGDTESNRPLVIVLPDANLMPPVINKTPLGSRRDSANVALCTQLALRGYVAASISHRLGWATSGMLENIRNTYAQALYRAIQDANTCVRYFKRQAVEEQNRFGVDIDKIALGGFGFGGLVATGAAYLDRPEEILLGKLKKSTGEPFIDPFFLGDFEARDTAVICRPNHSAYTSDFQLVFNIGGALLDSSWIEAGDIPPVNFHVPDDPLIPYRTGFIRVPFSNDILFEVHGSHTIALQARQLGILDTFFTAGFVDSLTLRGRDRSDGLEGLYPFIRPKPQAGELYDCGLGNGETLPRRAEHSPWSWWNEEAFIAQWTRLLGNDPISAPLANCNELAANPDMSPEKGRAYMDTILNYLNPRFLRTFGFITSREPAQLSDAQLRIYPNPTRGQLSIELHHSPGPLVEVQLYDAFGRHLRTYLPQNGYRIELALPPTLPAGMYVVYMRTRTAQAVRKIWKQ